MGGGVLASSFLNTTTSRGVRGLGDREERETLRDGWPQAGSYKVGQREGADGPWNSRSGKVQLVKSVNPLTGQIDVGYFTVGSEGLLTTTPYPGPLATRAYFVKTAIPEGSNVLNSPTLNKLFPATLGGSQRLGALMNQKSRLLETSASLVTLMLSNFLERGSTSVSEVMRSGMLSLPQFQARMQKANFSIHRHVRSLLLSFGRADVGVDSNR
ncbi:hypothetical protein T484DRAFT_1787569 [Baffinella frigidus]|nr:hypothetical protein T484DRAFT_1787569 [Cryptophyta sp. CCMP2293]